MKFYDKYILPRVVHIACSQNTISRQRQKIIPLAEGRILEIGFGSGLNLPFYDTTKVKHLWALDPSSEMRAITTESIETLPFNFEFLLSSAEEIPLENNTVDTVVVTYSLCTIPDVMAALKEIRRTLKIGGIFLFCEHGKAPELHIEKWQYRLNPLWKKLAGGCNLNRFIPGLIKKSGLNIKKLETMYLPGWKPASFNYWGYAK
ncbi:MAG: class I SAM-dependent methyltransferase [Fidelibacterota bacterium]